MPGSSEWMPTMAVGLTCHMLNVNQTKLRSAKARGSLRTTSVVPEAVALPEMLTSPDVSANGTAFRTALRLHLPALDGLRGVAILAVLCFHLTDILGVSASSSWIDRGVHKVFAQGWMGVDLFFVLSGLLITGVLLDAEGTSHYFRNFYMRRVLRIFPLYYAVVGFYLVILPIIAPRISAEYGVVVGNPIYYWLYFSNHAIAQGLAGGKQQFVGVLGPTWSLGVEEQFYLVWPLLVYFLSRRGMVRACVGAVAMAIALRIVLLSSGVHWAYISTLTPCRLDALAIGGLLACLIRQRHGIAALARRAVPTSIVSAALFAFIIAAQHLFAWDQGRLRYAFGFTLVATLSACVMLFAIAGPRRRLLSRALSNPVLTSFGKYSYGLYLLHVPLQEVIRRWMIPVNRFPMLGKSHLPGMAVYIALSLGVYFAAAWLSWHLLEEPFFRLKRYFPRGRRRSTSTGG